MKSRKSRLERIFHMIFGMPVYQPIGGAFCCQGSEVQGRGTKAMGISMKCHGMDFRDTFGREVQYIYI